MPDFSRVQGKKFCPLVPGVWICIRICIMFFHAPCLRIFRIVVQVIVFGELWIKDLKRASAVHLVKERISRRKQYFGRGSARIPEIDQAVALSRVQQQICPLVQLPCIHGQDVLHPLPFSAAMSDIIRNIVAEFP